MCGIIAYKGGKHAAPLILEGLKRLEYRGYDSWGIGSPAAVIKKTGKVGEASEHELTQLGQDGLAIGHSRWATNGTVNDANAHPHVSNGGRFVLVHNGIVENAHPLREDLARKGYAFSSETDSEVIVNLIESLSHEKDVTEAVRSAFLQLEGRNAVVVMDKETQQLFGVRFGSPLIAGIGRDEYFLASDVPAFLRHTRDVHYLDDYQMVVVDGSLHYLDVRTGKEVHRRTVRIDWDAEQAEKGDYPHFMIKEIHEQRETIRRAIEQDEDNINRAAEMIQNARGTFLSGCGTAGKVCHIGEYFFNAIARRHTNFVIGSEFTNYTPFLNDRSLLMVVSQSGETADVLEAIEQAKEKGVDILSLVNVQGSSIMRASDTSLMVKAGPEQAVASTKATTAQMSVLALLAYAADGRLQDGKLRLTELVGQINEWLNPRYEEHIAKLARQLEHVNDMYFIGRGVNYPLALECAIKVQEVSYVHGEGFAGGELKHGPLALIKEGTPVVALVADDQNKAAILSNAREVRSRGGYVIGVSPTNEDVFDEWLRVPNEDILSPIVNIIPVQMLAYHLGILRGNNPDKPRNLAKSVTVK